MSKFVVKSKDLLLYLLYIPGKDKDYNEPIVGRTRITKMIFLFEKEILPTLKQYKEFDVDGLPDFIAYNYGPYSKDLMSDLELLSNLDYVKQDYTDDEISDVEKATLEKTILDDYDDYLGDISDIELTGNDNSRVSNETYTTFSYDDDDDYGDDMYIKEEEESYKNFNQVKYSLSDKGIDYVQKQISSIFTETQKQILQKFKARINTLDLSLILEYVYNKYPDSAENSLIKERYLKN